VLVDSLGTRPLSCFSTPWTFWQAFCRQPRHKIVSSFLTSFNEKQDWFPVAGVSAGSCPGYASQTCPYQCSWSHRLASPCFLQWTQPAKAIHEYRSLCAKLTIMNRIWRLNTWIHFKIYMTLTAIHTIWIIRKATFLDVRAKFCLHFFVFLFDGISNLMKRNLHNVPHVCVKQMNMHMCVTTTYKHTMIDLR